MSSSVWLFMCLRSVFDASSRKLLVVNPQGLSTGARRTRSGRSRRSSSACASSSAVGLPFCLRGRHG
jgi:hypothetical protein